MQAAKVGSSHSVFDRRFILIHMASCQLLSLLILLLRLRSIESCQKMRYKADYKPTQMLCPKFYNWVDAAVAISKLQMTPHHICPLAEPAPNHDEEKDSDSTTTKNSKMMANSSLNLNDDILEALNVLQMDIGAGMNVTIDMLHSSGVDVVKPILKEFILEFSPALSKKCILKLN